MAQQIENKRKMSSRTALLLGLLIGLAATAGVYSIANTLAQTNTTTTSNQNFPFDRPFDGWGHRGGTWIGNQTGFLSFHALSRVQNVTVTGFNITSTNQITINLKYSGTGTTPAITIVGLSGASSGSTVLQAGWSSPDAVTVNLTGSSTLSNNGCTMVLVVPYTG